MTVYIVLSATGQVLGVFKDPRKARHFAQKNTAQAPEAWTVQE